MSCFFITVYFITLFIPFSSYALYPVIIWVLGKLAPIKLRKEDITPSISVLISAYNEAKYMETKIKNTLALDYPKDKIEILIGSDGSTDNTSEIAEQYEDQQVRCVNFETNRGKTAVQNDLVDLSMGKILVFTDAASFLPEGAARKIVRNFADDRVGCVAGKMQFVGTDTNLTTQSQGLYWSYESKIRELESNLGSLVGVDGPLYAVRRECYIPLEHHIISDLLTPLLILQQGRKAVLEPEALVSEDPTQKGSQEFNTRRRITLRGLIGLSSYGAILNPFRHPMLAFQILFHKIFRWFVGPLILLNLLACLALSAYWIFKIILMTYLLFFMAAALGWITERRGIKVRILTVPYYFSLVNLAATMGIMDFIRKRQASSWNPVRN